MTNFVGIIGGAGRIGLVLATALARNCHVDIYDTDSLRINELIENRKSEFFEPGLDDLIDAYLGNYLEIQENLTKLIVDNQFIFITIGTGVDRFLNPDFEPIYELFRTIGRIVNREKIERTFIICSTVYPGTTNKLEEFVNSGSKYKQHFAFCPERMQTSHMVNEIQKLPQIVCARRPDVRFQVADLFKVNGIEVIELDDPMEGELAKLFTNAYRYISFAVPNYFYMLADKMGCNYENIQNAMTLGYSRMKDFPKPLWTGGSCLIKDTLQLASVNNTFQLGYDAFRVNEHLPLHIFRKVRDHFGSDFNKKTIGILGMAFKDNTDDARESLAYRLRKLFNKHCTVLCHDHYIKNEIWTSVDSILEKSDAIIIGAYHGPYLSINFDKCNAVLVDLIGFYKAKRRL